MPNTPPARAEPELLFLLGAPRSGTTWLQVLLSHHPDIAAGRETHIFSAYLGRFVDRWEWESRHGADGLTKLMEEREFEEFCKGIALAALQKIREMKPDARLICEKSPSHSIKAPYIHRLFPHGHFLHLVRDPRDVVASLRAAGRGWGAYWASTSVVDSARSWRTHVEGALSLSGAPRYLQVSYERLRHKPEAELARIYDWLHLPVEPDGIRRAVEETTLEKLRNSSVETAEVQSAPQPPGFYRSGVAGGWRSELSGSDLAAVEEICAPLMDQLGYSRALTGRGGSTKRRLFDGIERVRDAVDWRLDALQRRWT